MSEETGTPPDVAPDSRFSSSSLGDRDRRHAIRMLCGKFLSIQSPGSPKILSRSGTWRLKDSRLRRLVSRDESDD